MKKDGKVGGNSGEPPMNPKMPPAKGTNGKDGFRTGQTGKVWGTQYGDWIPSLMLNPVR